MPIVIAYLGHAYWVFRGKTASANEDLDAEVAPSPAGGIPHRCRPICISIENMGSCENMGSWAAARSG
ncbi:hypothetical protein [Methyloferula stellata]|uniref:hypothetical protein n=1 Tax=Methyloferula stellata TaxID=876270 RepID=UPI000369EBF9|nr:hypothetical protein [Methyloferula stellata]